MTPTFSNINLAKNYKLLVKQAQQSPLVYIPAKTIQRQIRRYIHRQRKANVAMLHIGRCGSTVLGNMLNQNPGIYWAGEIFESMPAAYYKMDSKYRANQVIADRQYLHDIPFYGFETKYLPEQHLNPDLANSELSKYIKKLEETGFTHFVLLKRKNLLRQAVSTAIGQRTQMWYSKETNMQTKNYPIHIDVHSFCSYGHYRSLIEYLDVADKETERVSKLIAGLTHLELTYEDDIEFDPTQGYRKLCDFMGATAYPAKQELKRLNPAPLNELVANLDEISTLLEPTRFAWMIHE